MHVCMYACMYAICTECDKTGYHKILYKMKNTIILYKSNLVSCKNFPGVTNAIYGMISREMTNPDII